MSDFSENCWVLRGLRSGKIAIGILSHVSKGAGSSVEFDWGSTCRSRFLIGWFHTHPGPKSVTPSSMDDRTMRSWVKGYNKPFYCGIRGEDGTERLYYYLGISSCSGRKRTVYRKLVRYCRIGFFILVYDHIDYLIETV